MRPALEHRISARKGLYRTHIVVSSYWNRWPAARKPDLVTQAAMVALGPGRGQAAQKGRTVAAPSSQLSGLSNYVHEGQGGFLVPAQPGHEHPWASLRPGREAHRDRDGQYCA